MSHFSQLPPGDRSRLSRRDFLKASAAYAAALSLAGCGGGGGAPGTPAASSAVAQPTSALVDSNLLLQPQVRQSISGLLDTRLRVGMNQQQIAGTSFVSRTYEGMLPGPTLKFRAGDTVRVLLENNLPPNTDPGPPPDMNVPHHFNTTNLHTHGLHVTPRSPGDDVLIEIEPGASFQYEYLVPPFHWDGSFWYHAHKHGATTTQVNNGMAGALIIPGPTDEVPEIAAARDLILFIQDTRYQNGAALDYNTVNNVPQNLTVNGQLNPTIVMRPGEVQRWRLFNAGWFLTTQIALEGHVMHQIAADGITFPRVRDTASVTLASGNRADVLVQAQRPGTYLLQSVGYDQGFGSVLTPITLATVVVLEFSQAPMALPTVLPAPSFLSFNFPVINRTRQLTFIETFNPTFMVSISPAPGIPGLMFDPTRVDQTMNLDAVEEWTIVNTSPDQHPFHIHVNPFLLTQVNGVPVPEPVWLDTISVPAAQGATPGSVTFRTRFQTYTGQYVLHCHLLQHEDTGMMELIEVV